MQRICSERLPLAALVALVASAAMADCQPHWDHTIGQPGLGGQSPNGLSLAVHDGWLYAGGMFATAGGIDASRIARWNGVVWWPLLTGMNQTVWGMNSFDDGSGEALFIAGNFTAAAGLPAEKLARWSGTQFSPLGEGVSDVGGAAAIGFLPFDEGNGETLFVNGNFTHAGGVLVNYIARWHPDSQSYSSVGGGMNNQVNTMIAFDDGLGGGEQLYVGGWFTTAGGVPANRVARWDPSLQTWSPLGNGLEGPVLALAVFDDGNGPALYAGGAFEAGGADHDYVARWDPAAETWSQLGESMDSQVNALAVFDDGGGQALYASGLFQNIGDVSASRISRWDGEQWTALAGGLDGSGRAMVVYEDSMGSALYVAGTFDEVDGVPARGIVAWRGCPAPPLTPGDLNGDGAVDVADLLTLLADWGPCRSCTSCPADLTGDCNVGVTDLLLLLSNWG